MAQLTSLFCADIRPFLRRIWLEMYESRREVSGKIDELGRVHSYGPAGSITAPAEMGACGAAWHTHPPRSVLAVPEDDVFFLPPSSADVFYVLLGAYRRLYRHSLVISIEGMYTIVAEGSDAINRELTALGYGEDADNWDMPAEPLVEDTGLTGFRWDPENQHEAPLLTTLLSDWDVCIMNTAAGHREALAAYQKQLLKFSVTTTFVPESALGNYSRATEPLSDTDTE